MESNNKTTQELAAYGPPTKESTGDEPKIKASITVIRDLKDEELLLMEKAENYMYGYNRLYGMGQLIEPNLIAFVNHIDEIVAKAKQDAINTPEIGNEFQLELNRRLINLLASFSAFMGHTYSVFKSEFGAADHRFRDLKIIWKDLKSLFKASGILMVVRNISQHTNMPIEIFSHEQFVSKEELERDSFKWVSSSENHPGAQIYNQLRLAIPRKRLEEVAVYRLKQEEADMACKQIQAVWPEEVEMVKLVLVGTEELLKGRNEILKLYERSFEPTTEIFNKLSNEVRSVYKEASPVIVQVSGDKDRREKRKMSLRMIKTYTSPEKK